MLVKFIPNVGSLLCKVAIIWPGILVGPPISMWTLYPCLNRIRTRCSYKERDLSQTELGLMYTLCYTDPCIW
jgi:hypothetical protein